MKSHWSNASLIKYWQDLRASYWFVPAVMVVGAIMLAFLVDWIDRSYATTWIAHVPWLYGTQPAGARAMLAAIATSMMGVAGVTFSMTTVAVSFAAAQFGPRLIGNFMRDRGNQVTLGTFIATFVYCLLVLRSVTDASGPGHAARVPQISMLVALALAMASVLVLIYFIHHIPESINVSRIASSIGKSLQDSVKTVFPQEIGTERECGSQSSAIDFASGGLKVRCERSGYLQAVDEGRVMALATEHDLVIRLEYRPGDFAPRGAALFVVHSETGVDENLTEQLAGCVAFGIERTPQQNVLFLVDQLVEILVRALSPGVNDPFTAIACLDWLQSALVEIVQREPPEGERYDESGDLRFISRPVDFDDFAEAIFAQSLQYVATDRNVALHAMSVLAEITASADRDRDRAILLKHAEILAQSAERSLPLKVDRGLVAERYAQTARIATDYAYRQLLRESGDWFGGRG